MRPECHGGSREALSRTRGRGLAVFSTAFRDMKKSGSLGRRTRPTTRRTGSPDSVRPRRIGRPQSRRTYTLPAAPHAEVSEEVSGLGIHRDTLREDGNPMYYLAMVHMILDKLVVR